MSNLEKILSIYMKEDLGDGVVVYCLNPIEDQFPDIVGNTYGGGFDTSVCRLPFLLRQFLEDFSKYNAHIPEDPRVTRKIISLPAYLMAEIREDGCERYLGAIHSIERKLYDEIREGCVGEVKFRINIREDARGRGHGKALLRILEKCYLDKGYALVCMFSKKNDAARRFFEQMGFMVREDGRFCYRAIKVP